MTKRPTLRDVSRVANVSMFTVSRAMTNGDGVSEATRQRVLKVANDLGYVPNQLARGLRGGRTRTIGILAANSTNLFYSTLVASVEKVLRRHGFHSLVMDAVLDGEYQPDREDAFVEDLIQHQVAAVVLTYSIASRNVQRLLDRGMELVFVDTQPPEGFEDIVSIASDSYAGTRVLGEHLLQHGYSGRWAFVGYPHSYGSRAPREAGFTDVATEAGITLDVIEGSNDAQSAFRAIDAYLMDLDHDDFPRAIFTSNELLLQGLLRASRRHDSRIPEDIAVVSYDDFAWADYIEPSITVIDQRIDLIGTAAAETLLAELDIDIVPAHSGTRVLITPELILRRSCGCHEEAVDDRPGAANA